MSKAIDKVTRQWIRNRSDELAARAGCCFDEEAAGHVCEFFENDLRLYEGEQAGQPFKLMPWQSEALSRAFGWKVYSEDWGRWVRRFVFVFLWVPKKSGKSPLAAGVGVYLTTMDGEQGQKVYSAATDRNQAGIVHTHARKMIEQSRDLSSECDINNTTGRILHGQTNSVYSIISGDNIKGQEGLNGSAIIDECHVVNKRLYSTLKYMTASRSEPMIFGVSTAGNNPEGFGRKQCEYGRNVEKGTIVDQRFLHIEYGVADDATDEECMKEETWKKANPSWGYTIKPDEFRASAGQARQQGLSDWNDFKMYRLNQWQKSSNPWLHMHHWEACGRWDWDLSEYYKQPASFGLDLSRSKDMSAMTVTIPLEDEWFAQYTWLWITQAYADAFGEGTHHNIQFGAWGGAGYLTIIPGETIKQEYVKRRFRQVAQQFKVMCLTYDKTYAQEFIEWVEDGMPDEVSGKVERVKFTVECVEMSQSYAMMEGAIDEFEAMVVDRRLMHSDNECLNWQAGHTHVVSNARGQRMFKKPERGEPQKIDGMVSSVMSHYGARTSEVPRESVYRKRGVIAV